ncbi:MAG: pilus assembly PilX N-terminal domain-containing protein [Nitrospirae bacterium]|nr:pilus assembly PilX N-terminal domain-containing protein [Nitrospirota bacterium]
MMTGKHDEKGVKVNKKSSRGLRDLACLSARPLSSEQGVALVMVLVISMIALAIVSAVVYMITQGTRTSGYQRIFRSSEDAGFGGADLTKEYVMNRGDLNIPAVGIVYSLGCFCGNIDDVTDNKDLMTGARTCRCDKLCNGNIDTNSDGVPDGWATCPDEDGGVPGSQVSLDPTQNPDIMMDLRNPLDPLDPLTNYRVFSKIVNTVQGNTDVGGVVTGGRLGGHGVVEASSGVVNPPHHPFLYRIEVEAIQFAYIAAPASAPSRSRLSILMGY